MKAQSQRRLRQVHFWLGLFFAPTTLFFALSGSVQALGFQDRNAGYRPPEWISVIASVHKHGYLRRPDAQRTATPAKPAADAAPKQAKRAFPNTFSLFAALLGLLLAVATALGIWIGLLNRRDRRTSILLLAGGTVLPLLLLLA